MVKLVRADLAADEELVRDFLAEGTSAGSLEHPGIVRFYEAARAESDLFSVHDHFAGTSLAAMVARPPEATDPLRTELVLWIGARVARGLELAHDTQWSRGAAGEMIHLGLAPRSILLGYDGAVALAGMGSGRARTRRPPSATRMPYAAPELFRRRAPDRRADLFSLGVILFEGVTGKRLFRRGSPADTRAAILEDPIPSLVEQLPFVSAPVANVISAMVTRDRNARPDTASEVAKVLEAAQERSGDELAVALSSHLERTFAAERAAANRVLESAFERAASDDKTPRSGDLRSVSVGTVSASGADTPATKAHHVPVDGGLDDVGEITDIQGRVVTPRIIVGGDAPTPTAGEAPTPRKGGEAPTPRKGGEAPTPRAGGEAPTPRGGGEAPTPRHGGEAPTPSNGGAPPRRASGAGAPTPRSGGGAAAGRLAPSATVEKTMGEAVGGGAASHRVESDPVDVPTRIARYQVRAALGRRGASRAYRARDPNVGRQVVLHVVDASAPVDDLSADQRIALMQREARFVGKISHSGMAVLLDAGRDGDLYFLVYELVEGTPFDRWVESLGIDVTLPRLAPVLGAVGEALAHLHDNNLVHGSVCAPSLVILEDGRAKLCDSSFVGVDGDADHPLRASHTPALCPELLTAGRYVAASDQFALGVMLYTALAGRPPFVGATSEALAEAVAEAVPPSFDGIDPELAVIIRRLIAAEPRDRYADIHELQASLQAEPRTSPELSVQTVAPAPGPGDVLIVDDAIDPRWAAELWGAAAVVPTVRAALEQLRSAPVSTLIVSEACAPRPRELLRRVRRVRPGVKVRVVPPLLDRLTGNAADDRTVADGILELMAHVVELGADEAPRSPVSGLDMVEGVAERMGLGRRGALEASLAFGARRMADRLDVPATSEPVSSCLPLEVQSLLAAIERFWTMPLDPSAPHAAPLVQVVAMVERYDELTHPGSDGKRLSPRKALLALRNEAQEGRLDSPTVEALVSHMRDAMSALELPPLARPKQRVCLCGAQNPELELALAKAGYDVAVEGGDEMGAWQQIAAGDFDGLVIGAGFSGDQTARLLRLLRSGPRTEHMAVVVTSIDTNETFDESTAAHGPIELLTSEAGVGRVIEALAELMPVA